MDLVPIQSSEQMTLDEERNHWSGIGSLIFDVITYSPENYRCNQYEINWIDYTGCIGGLDETLGIEYAVNEGILGDIDLKLGYRYILTHIKVVCTRGDGWTTDDDIDYYVGNIERQFILSKWLYAWWWHYIGYRIRNWRQL